MATKPSCSSTSASHSSPAARRRATKPRGARTRRRSDDTHDAVVDSEEFEQLRRGTMEILYPSVSGCFVCGALKSDTGCKLKQCAQCKVARYCSTEHQRAHWKERHKRECKSLKEMSTSSTGLAINKLLNKAQSRMTENQYPQAIAPIQSAWDIIATGRTKGEAEGYFRLCPLDVDLYILCKFAACYIGMGDNRTALDYLTRAEALVMSGMCFAPRAGDPVFCMLARHHSIHLKSSDTIKKYLDLAEGVQEVDGFCMWSNFKAQYERNFGDSKLALAVAEELLARCDRDRPGKGTLGYAQETGNALRLCCMTAGPAGKAEKGIAYGKRALAHYKTDPLFRPVWEFHVTMSMAKLYMFIGKEKEATQSLRRMKTSGIRAGSPELTHQLESMEKLWIFRFGTPFPS